MRIPLLLAFLLTTTLYGQEAVKNPTELPDWETNVEVATEKAKKENKLMLILFSGPEWCPYCRRANELVFLKPEFKPLIEKEVVLVIWHIPKLEVDEKPSRDAYFKYGVKGYPIAILMYPDGTRITQLTPGGGDETPQRFAEKIQTMIAHSQSRPLLVP